MYVFLFVLLTTGALVATLVVVWYAAKQRQDIDFRSVWEEYTRPFRSKLKRKTVQKPKKSTDEEHKKALCTLLNKEPRLTELRTRELAETYIRKHNLKWHVSTTPDLSFYTPTGKHLIIRKNEDGAWS